MRRFPWIAVVVLVLTACQEPVEEEPLDPDDREAVILPGTARPEVRQGMLTMLASLERATAELAAGDTAAAARAAAESGMGNAGMMPVTVRRTAPAPFLSLGMSAHQGFDLLARRASSGAPPDSTLAALTAILNACTSCHDRFRADWRHGGEERLD